MCGAALGLAFLTIPEKPIFPRLGDRMITATWLGLLTMAALLLGLSVVVPLSPTAGFGLVAIVTSAAASMKSVRADFKALLASLAKPVALGVGALAVVVALNSTRFVEAYDTGLYHYPLTRWLSTYGTVRGLALIHFRFGFSSSWFALAAPFDFGSFQGRIAALLGGLAILLCLWHFALAVSRILQRRADQSDWFLAGGYTFILLICFSWAFELSLSPDVPVWILTLLVGWLMLVSGRSKGPSKPETGSDHSPIVVLLLALCTITLKPSAAPIVSIAGLFYWFNSPWRWSTRLLYGVIASLFALPILAANVKSSGCPLYPSSLGCTDVPWGVGKEAARVIAADIGDWGRWRDAAGSPAGNWVVSWISQPDKLVLISFCGICLLGFVALRGWRGNKSSLYVLGLALFGTVFLLVNAPNPRFGVGYFSLYPALLLAVLGPKLERLWGDRPELPIFKGSKGLAYVALATAAIVAIHGSEREFRFERELRGVDNLQTSTDSKLSGRLLLPPALASTPGDLVITKNRRLNRIGQLELVTDRTNGIDYRSPRDRDQCWAAALPCVPTQLDSDVSLRVPSDGFRSGFVRSAKLSDVSRR